MLSIRVRITDSTGQVRRVTYVMWRRRFPGTDRLPKHVAEKINHCILRQPMVWLGGEIAARVVAVGATLVVVLSGGWVWHHLSARNRIALLVVMIVVLAVAMLALSDLLSAGQARYGYV